MKTKFKFLTMAIMTLSLCLTSCSSEDGAPGQAGQDGANGINGQDGQDGNANVTSSAWITSTLGDDGPSGFVVQDITGNNINDISPNNDVLLVYGRLSIADAIVSLPVVFENKSYYFALINDTNVTAEPTLRLIGNTTDDDTNGSFFEISEFRYVIIPSNISGSSGRSALSSKEAKLEELYSKGVDVNDFYQVADYYNLDY